MNEAKCCAPVELLNDIAQEIIDQLAKIADIANIIEGRLYGLSPQNECDKKLPPDGLQNKLTCIRSQAGEVGSTLDAIRMKL